ncbi:MAG: GNAT family protein [Acidimicrobiales bacterium]
MDDRGELSRLWPLYGLRVRTPRLELRYPSDDDLCALAQLSGDIHDPGFLPFSGTWSLLPDGERERTVLQYHWGRRSDWTAERWRLELVVVVDGKVVGTQGALAEDFPITRTVTTGSWLGRAHQRRGIGSEMRAAVLHLAFAGLGAQRAESDAVEDNGPSLGVTTKLGYRPNGDSIDATNGKRTRLLRFVLDREVWERDGRRDIKIAGLDACLPMFGLGDESSDAVT